MSYLDTPIEATVSQYTPNYSPDQIKQMKYDLDVLAKENETFRLDIVSLRNTISSLQRQNSYANNLLTNAKVIILGAFDGDAFGKDVVTNIAEALDITLVNKHNVIITVTYHGTIESPADADIERFEEHVDFECSPFSDEWEFDIYPTDTHIAYTEA